jgi:hypothetical protein
MKVATVFGLSLAGLFSSVSPFGHPFHTHQSGGDGRFSLHAALHETVEDVIRPMIKCETSQRRLKVLFLHSSMVDAH